MPSLTYKVNAMAERKKLGEIFVDHGIISPKTVERLLSLAKKQGKRFGELLELLGIITGEELAVGLATQYGYKVAVNFVEYDYPRDLVSLVPVEVALQHHLFPLKRDKGLLALAMADPTDTRIINNFGANIGMKIVPFIATRDEIYKAICRHYLGKALTAEPGEHTVLLVEDEKAIAEKLKKTLHDNGFKVVTATDGFDAFRQVIAEKPQVIVTDKEMPKMDGYGLLSAIRKIPGAELIPVILMTDRKMKDVEEAKAFEKGFFDYIEKPVGDITLISRVRRALKFYEHRYIL